MVSVPPAVTVDGLTVSDGCSVAASVRLTTAETLPASSVARNRTTRAPGVTSTAPVYSAQVPITVSLPSAYSTSAMPDPASVTAAAT